ncbi:MAG: zinc metallopeptidase [Spirochaetales bacterium]|nr:zinc metallopeptidase [Spirochaetales bacterium]
MFYLDPLYLGIMLITVIITGIASLMVKTAFSAGQKVKLVNGISGAEAAQRILDVSGITDVKIVKTRGFLSDHYNPMTKTLALSPAVYEGRSASSAGVAAHEVGHAIQHARGYFPLKFRSALVPMASIGSRFGIFLIIISIIMQGVSKAAEGTEASMYIGVAGLALFASAALFSIVTVPVEFNASSRAKVLLRETGIVQTSGEEAAVRRVLTAAGLTYVAAALTAILQVLYWAIKLGLLGNRRD